MGLGGLFLWACGNGSGSLTGSVLVESPQAGWQAVGATVTVELKSGNRVVAAEHVIPHHQFQFTEPSGTYNLRAVGIRNCSHTVTIGSGRSITHDLRCVPASAAG